jgi:CTP synthase (UTP-ammonia lyase)
MHDVSNIWQVPCMMMAQKAHVTVCNVSALQGCSSLTSTRTNKLANKWDSLTETVTILGD